MTHGKWEIRQEPFSSKPQWIGDWIYYSSTEDGPSQRQFYRIHPDGNGKEKLSTTPGLHVGSVSEDGRFTAVTQANEKNPFDLWVNNERVTKSPRPEFYAWSWPEIRYVQFPSKVDRKLVSAKLMLPPGASKTRDPQSSMFMARASRPVSFSSGARITNSGMFTTHISQTKVTLCWISIIAAALGTDATGAAMYI